LFGEANRDVTDAESPFPLFFSFSATFKNSSPREKVAKLSSFWDRWTESLFVSIIVAKYNIGFSFGKQLHTHSVLLKILLNCFTIQNASFISLTIEFPSFRDTTFWFLPNSPERETKKHVFLLRQSTDGHKKNNIFA